MTKVLNKTKSEDVAKKAKKTTAKKTSKEKTVVIEADNDIRGKVKTALTTIFEYDAAQQKATAVEDLLDESGKRSVNLQFTFTRCKSQPDKAPLLVDVPHPIYDLEDSSVCFICKVPQRAWKDRVAAEDLPMIKRVIDIGKIMKRYQQQQLRNQFRREYDIFLADSHLVTALNPFLGTSFRNHPGKMPWVVRFTDEERAGDVPIKPKIMDTLTKKTRMLFTVGDRVNVRIGQRSSSVQDLADNAQAVLDFLDKYMNEVLNQDLQEEKWHLREIYVSLSGSLSVPIRQCVVQ